MTRASQIQVLIIIQTKVPVATTLINCPANSGSPDYLFKLHALNGLHSTGQLHVFVAGRIAIDTGFGGGDPVGKFPRLRYQHHQ